MRKIKKARETMRRAFMKDEGFWDVYIANVAMCIYDHPKSKMSKEDCNLVAIVVLNKIFKDC